MFERFTGILLGLVNAVVLFFSSLLTFTDLRRFRRMQRM
jgi:hypothetical protein